MTAPRALKWVVAIGLLCLSYLLVLGLMLVWYSQGMAIAIGLL